LKKVVGKICKNTGLLTMIAILLVVLIPHFYKTANGILIGFWIGNSLCILMLALNVINVIIRNPEAKHDLSFMIFPIMIFFCIDLFYWKPIGWPIVWKFFWCYFGSLFLIGFLWNFYPE